MNGICDGSNIVERDDWNLPLLNFYNNYFHPANPPFSADVFEYIREKHINPDGSKNSSDNEKLIKICCEIFREYKAKKKAPEEGPQGPEVDDVDLAKYVCCYIMPLKSILGNKSILRSVQ
jgi:hypothetical protein